jgi:hypothetical protein
MSQEGLANGTKTGIGSLASEETKQEWKSAWDFYVTVRGARADRLNKVAEKFGYSRKGAKRRIKNYEHWQLNETGQLPPDPFRAETLALGNSMLEQKRAARRVAAQGQKRHANPRGSRTYSSDKRGPAVR